MGWFYGDCPSPAWRRMRATMLTLSSKCARGSCRIKSGRSDNRFRNDGAKECQGLFRWLLASTRWVGKPRYYAEIRGEAGMQNLYDSEIFIFGIQDVAVKRKETTFITLRSQRSHGDDGWWSGWQQRRGSCRWDIRLAIVPTHFSSQRCVPVWIQSDVPPLPGRTRIFISGRGATYETV
jgi:hypothetical protein